MFGSFYGLAAVEKVPPLHEFKDFAKSHYAKYLSDTLVKTSKDVIKMAPFINKQGTIDTLSGGFEAADFQKMLGLCYSNQLYLQMARGLVHPDLLEFLSNQK